MLVVIAILLVMSPLLNIHNTPGTAPKNSPIQHIVVIMQESRSLDVKGGDVAGFSSNLKTVNASGEGYSTIQLSNLSSAEVTMGENGTALVTGVLDVTINGTEKLSGVDVTISLAQLRALNMTLGEPDYLDEPIYGTANPQEENTAAAGDIMTDGSSILDNITEKFRLPQLQNPFK